MASPQAAVNRAGRALVGVALAVIVSVGVIVAAASMWFRDAVYVDRAKPAQQTDVIIPRGATFAQVVAALQDKGVLQHALAFRILARLRHVDTDVKSGEYRFPARQTSDEILQRLVRGEQFAAWVTIPEGYTAREIARTLATARSATRAPTTTTSCTPAASPWAAGARPTSKGTSSRAPT